MAPRLIIIIAVGACIIIAGPSVPPAAIESEPSPLLTSVMAAVSADRMFNDIRSLSAFNGRQTGSFEDLQSGMYVMHRFQALGLQPPWNPAVEGDRWTMTASTDVPHIAESPVIEFRDGQEVIKARLGEEYLPILDSPSVDVGAQVIFVGYGISDPDSGFDEYDDFDVRGQVVLFLRGKPESYKRNVSHADKVRTAINKGAVAYLTATGPILNPYEARRGFGLLPLAYYTNVMDATLPGAWISTALAERILVGSTMPLRERQAALNSRLTPRSFSTRFLARLQWQATRGVGKLINVIGVIPGQDGATSRSSVLIVGAHRDHFGLQAGLLFPGADDNASGTAILLEVARVLSEIKRPPSHTILFVSFSGEEQGLLGSRLYISQPRWPLKATVAMLNVDHAGAGNGRLLVGLTGIPNAVGHRAGELAGLGDRLDVFGFFPGGDHVPFHEAGIPTATIVGGGPHPDFHRPTDTPHNVNRDIVQMAARYLAALTWELAYKP